MAFIDGDDFVNGSVLSYQQARRMKNHWRQADPPDNPSSGMLHSDSDDDKFYHRAAGVWNELLQSGGPSEETAIADATGAGDVVDRLNDVIHTLETLGLLAT